MFYDIYKHEMLRGAEEWPVSKNYINARSLPEGENICVPVLRDNALILGKIGYGKTTLTRAVVDALISEEEEPYTVFLDVKDDFRTYIRPEDKVVSFEKEEEVNCFQWNLIKELRQSRNQESELEAIAGILFSELMNDNRNRFWVEGAKAIFKAFIKVILYRYSNCPANKEVIEGIRYMSQSELIAHLVQYKPNRSVLRDYFGYDVEHPERYVQPKRTGDMMAFLATVLDKFDGTFCSADGADTIHDFLNGAYGKRLFLQYDYSKRAAANIFFRFMLQKIIEERLSQYVDRTKRVLLVLDEAATLESDFGLMEAATLGRGNNLQVILASQSIEKLYCVAPERNNEHITNASLAGFPTVITFQPGDPQTIEVLLRLFGNRHKVVITMPLSRYTSPQSQYVTEPIVKEEDLSGLGVGECYVKIRSCLPQKVKILV